MSTSLITLLIYILILVPGMLAGFFFARRKMFTPHHKYTMTAITIFNWILIIAVMFISYRNYVLPSLPGYLSDIRGLLATIHLVTGALAQLLATYLVIMMWTENTSMAGIVPYRFKNIKRPMRLTLALWLTTVILGIGIYVTWYAAPATAEDIPPASTEEAASTEAAVDPYATTVPSSTEEASAASTEAADDDKATPESTEAPDPNSTEEAD